MPMSLIRDAYRDAILGGLADAGEQVLHVFLEVDAAVLRDRLYARVTEPGRTWDEAPVRLAEVGAPAAPVAVTHVGCHHALAVADVFLAVLVVPGVVKPELALDCMAAEYRPPVLHAPAAA
ncbi:MAG TPA: hypothetical protein VGG35_13850, partial [Streptosporangiaceae bacterium]